MMRFTAGMKRMVVHIATAQDVGRVLNPLTPIA